MSKTTAVGTLVARAGLSRLTIEGINAAPNIKFPIDRTQSCQGITYINSSFDGFKG